MGAFLGMVWGFALSQRTQMLPCVGGGTKPSPRLTRLTSINRFSALSWLKSLRLKWTQAVQLPWCGTTPNTTNQWVFDKAKELAYLPAYSPNLTLIECLWRFVKKQVWYSKHYDPLTILKIALILASPRLAFNSKLIWKLSWPYDFNWLSEKPKT